MHKFDQQITAARCPQQHCNFSVRKCSADFAVQIALGDFVEIQTRNGAVLAAFNHCLRLRPYFQGGPVTSCARIVDSHTARIHSRALQVLNVGNDMLLSLSHPTHSRAV
jgi:hypothetical protein